jgi:hypothetical protein
MILAWSSDSSRLICPSRRPWVAAKAALAVAIASKPSFSRSFAVPMSHGLGITNKLGR